MIYTDGQSYYNVSKESPKGFPNLFITQMGTDPTNLTETALTTEQIQDLEKVKDLPEEWCKAFKIRPKKKLKIKTVHSVEPVEPIIAELVPIDVLSHPCFWISLVHVCGICGLVILLKLLH